MTKMTPRVATGPSRRHVAGAVALVVGALAGCTGSGDEPTVRATGTSTTPTASGTQTPSASATTSAGSPSTSSSASTTAAGRTLAITVRGKKVSPAPSTVDLAVGTTLSLVVTIDHDDELHAHGFGVETTLRAGQATSVTLTGREPGVYEVETHEPALRLLKIAVR